jgi:hypothetical protein
MQRKYNRDNLTHHVPVAATDIGKQPKQLDSIDIAVACFRTIE